MVLKITRFLFSKELESRQGKKKCLSGGAFTSDRLQFL